MLFPANFTFFVGGVALAGIAASSFQRKKLARAQQDAEKRLLAERAAGHHLCFSTIEALAYAIEASDRFSQGHLDRVQRVVLTLPFDRIYGAWWGRNIAAGAKAAFAASVARYLAAIA